MLILASSGNLYSRFSRFLAFILLYIIFHHSLSSAKYYFVFFPTVYFYSMHSSLPTVCRNWCCFSYHNSTVCSRPIPTVCFGRVKLLLLPDSARLRHEQWAFNDGSGGPVEEHQKQQRDGRSESGGGRHFGGKCKKYFATIPWWGKKTKNGLVLEFLHHILLYHHAEIKLARLRDFRNEQ